MSRHRLPGSVFLVSFSVLSLAGATGCTRGAVTRHAAPFNPADLTIKESSQERTIDCKGGSVTIDGNENQLILIGRCSTLRVNGNDNMVAVEDVARISTWGNRNKVLWLWEGDGGKPPKISTSGTGNSIKQMEK